MTETAIREYRSSDIDAMVEIAIAAWTPIFANYRLLMGDDLFLTAFPDWQREKARQVRTACSPTSTAMVYVAEQDARVIGFITFYANDGTGIGEIGNNAVHPDHQGFGIGARMYEHAFARLRERGMRFVKVSTGGDVAHAPARKAYEKAGFCIQLPGVDYYRSL
jgi:ribosomal protein S18 acetylase RimI-like enzyme